MLQADHLDIITAPTYLARPRIKPVRRRQKSLGNTFAQPITVIAARLGPPSAATMPRFNDVTSIHPEPVVKVIPDIPHVGLPGNSSAVANFRR